MSTNSNGNITSIPPPIGGSATTLSYSVANRLSGVTGGGATTASYKYGAGGERVSKTVGSATTVYAYGLDELGGQLLEENNGSSVTDYIYVEGWLVGMYVGGTATAGTGGTNYYVHPDAQGDPALVTDDSMATVWSANRQPYGTTGTITSSISQNVRLPGQFFDAETGFHQNGFRDYMPNLGRYAEADPIGMGGGINPYLYGNANPTAYVDSRGLAPNDNYPSPDDAAKAAIRDINRTSIVNNVEYSGNIYQKFLGFGPYSYTAPENENSPDSSPTHHDNCPIFTTLRGDYHTHARLVQESDNNFSAEDKKIDDAASITGYLGTPSGQTKRYTPIPGRSQAGQVTVIDTGAK